MNTYRIYYRSVDRSNGHVREDWELVQGWTIGHAKAAFMARQPQGCEVATLRVEIEKLEG